MHALGLIPYANAIPAIITTFLNLLSLGNKYKIKQQVAINVALVVKVICTRNP